MRQTKIELQKVTCDSKNKYLTLTEAINKGKVEMRIRINQKQLYTYLCPNCYNYHLTHNPKQIDFPKYKI